LILFFLSLSLLFLLFAGQNLLSEETSARLLALLDPIAVFSGHDHAGCRHGRELTLTAVQAEYWGHALLYSGGSAEEAVSLWALHNSPSIVLLVASTLWPLLYAAFLLLSRRANQKPKIF
jgi:hypothetical protein